MTTPMVQAGLSGSAPLVPSSQENLAAVGHYKGVQLDKEGHTEAALRVFKRNLREPEDGQKGAKLWEKLDMFDRVRYPKSKKSVRPSWLPGTSSALPDWSLLHPIP